MSVTTLKNRQWPGLFACCFLLLLTACSKETGPSAPPPQQVTVAAPVIKEVTDWDQFTGRLAAVESVEVRARVSGYLESVHFREGRAVQQGDLLYVIDPRPYRATLDAATAQVAMAEAALRLAESDLRRVQRLITSRTVSEEELDAKTQERNRALAALDLARAAERAAQLDLEFTRIHAPISGNISRTRVTPGNLVNGGEANATLLTTIVSTDPVHFYFSGNEQEYLRYLRLARSGERPSSRTVQNPVKLRLSDEEGFMHEGVMDFVDNVVDTDTGTMTGRAIFDNPENILGPGMFAELRLIGAGPYEALQVPDVAIGFDQSQQFVYIVDKANTVHRRLVELGRLDGEMRIISSGLTADDQVVINGMQRVRAGMTVEPVRADAATD